MAMNQFNLLSYYDVAEDGEEGKDGWHSSLAVYYKEGYMIHLKAIRKIADSRPALVRMSDNHDLMAAVNELRRQLIDVTLDSPWLGKEEVTDHRNVVRHFVDREVIVNAILCLLNGI